MHGNRPTGRYPSAPGRVAVASICACLALPGCGDDSSGPTATPLGPPAIQIRAPAPGACVVLRDTPVLALSVHIATENWSLRPAGICGVFPQCGYAAYFVDGLQAARAAAQVVDVPFTAVATPSGPHRLDVELWSDSDEIALNHAGEPLRATVEFRTVLPGQSCETQGP